MTTYDPNCLREFLPRYYRNLFPFKSYYKWLSYGKKPSAYLINREFAFILKDDIYLRYRSFADQQELEKELLSHCPEKIDIGAVFNHPPKDHKKYRDFEARERELVFDIDLTDYDDIRTCCSGGGICKKCWGFMVIAVRIMDRALREDFGFRHCLWVFSGRRGVHCWVCDETARKLSGEGRSALAEYLTLVVGGESQKKKVNLSQIPRLHPSITAAVEVAESGKGGENSEFDELIESQEWLSEDKEKWDKVFQLIPSEELRERVREVCERVWTKKKTGKDVWRSIKFQLDAQAKDLAREKAIELPKECRHLYQELILQLCYPRLDINVTKGLNHLLKSPFCVHPKTGKIAVPVRAETIHLFNPEMVPRIDILMKELAQVKQEEIKSEDGVQRKTLDYKRTSLCDYIETFDAFIDGLLEDGENKENVRIPDLSF